jgi:hypothetical protein
VLCEFLAFLLSQHKRLRRCGLSIRFNLSYFVCIWGSISILWVKLLHKGIHLQRHNLGKIHGIIISPSMGTSVPHFCIIVRVVNSENGSNSGLNLGSQYPEPANTAMGIRPLHLQNGNLQNTESLCFRLKDLSKLVKLSSHVCYSYIPSIESLASL